MIRFVIFGRPFNSAIVPSTSAGQTKRMVRRGGSMRFSATSLDSARATSRIVAQPLALSFAPGRGWSRWQLKTISWSARSVPGMVAVAI